MVGAHPPLASGLDRSRSPQLSKRRLPQRSRRSACSPADIDCRPTGAYIEPWRRLHDKPACFVEAFHCSCEIKQGRRDTRVFGGSNPGACLRSGSRRAMCSRCSNYGRAAIFPASHRRSAPHDFRDFARSTCAHSGGLVAAARARVVGHRPGQTPPQGRPVVITRDSRCRVRPGIALSYQPPVRPALCSIGWSPLAWWPQG